jgi:2-polyprenyl-6-hydroxyphenyl methylase/3-demethylubiquinone-9 3-methyltransferase
MDISKNALVGGEPIDLSQSFENEQSTTEIKDITTFNEYEGKWWDANGPLKPLHQLNPIRLQFIKSQISRLKNIDPDEAAPYKNLSMLDVGCGAGLICEPLSRLGAKVTGIDASETALIQARSHAVEHDLEIDYQLVTVEEKLAQGLVYDVVFALEVVEHVSNVAVFLKSCAKLVKPGGILFLSTLNRTAMSYVKTILIAEYLLKWIPAGTHDWNRFLKPSELSEPLQEEGFYFTNLKGIDYNILKKEWYLTDSLATNYIGCAVKR